LTESEYNNGKKLIFPSHPSLSLSLSSNQRNILDTVLRYCSN